MFHVTSNPEKNRLHITLSGHMEGPERQVNSMVEADRRLDGLREG